MAWLKSQIDLYKTWYGANGVFFDEMADHNGKTAYFKSAAAYARKIGMVVVGNPGTFTSPSYAGICNVLVTYEDPKSAGWSIHKPAGWTSGKPARDFGAMVYAAPGEEMQAILDQAVARNYGWVCITDRGGRDPFGVAGTYHAALADAIKVKNAPK